MGYKVIHLFITLMAVNLIGATRTVCPSHPNCVCGGTLSIELNCNIDGRTVTINLLPNTYMNIKCENITTLDYSKLPRCADRMNTFKSVSFKDCPLPSSSFKDVLMQLGVSKTMSLIFQNTKKLSGYFNRNHFAGLQDLTKLLLSVNGLTHLPDNLFMDINNLTWLNIRCNNINLSEALFKPLEKLETLEISHNQMTNVSSNLFSHLNFLRKLSLWQSNVTWFSKDFFTGVDVLEELDLSSNGLNELPTSIFKPLTKLKKLTLFSNKFSSLPQNLFSTNNKLETVIILNNDVKIKELPRNLLGNLPNLKQIYIQRSGIENLPYDIFVNSPLVTNISLAYNDIAVLPESIFNDQINLLELDLSHNRIKKFESKIFSSLVRLERLDLCHNLLEEISGSTFSSLFSLIHLNMEHNRLKTISSYLFNNNRQRMSISFAYNQIDFESKELENNSWTVKSISPFAHTYNLKLLNLSHNKFRVTYDDWWINGHETLDISFNAIEYLWKNEKYTTNSCQIPRYEELIKKPIKEVWILNNPWACRCRNFLFLDFLRERVKSKIIDDNFIHCPIFTKEMCYFRFVIFVCVLTGVLFLSIIILTIYTYQKQIYFVIKKWTYLFCQRNQEKDRHKNVLVKYSEKDEEFVLKEILPVLKEQYSIHVHTKRICKANANEVLLKQTPEKSLQLDTVIVVFSPNYLTSAYSHVNIKKIRGEMLKTKNTVYVFTDIGPENSIYAFLKEQRDRRSTVLWNDSNFWNVILGTPSVNLKKAENGISIKQDFMKLKKLDEGYISKIASDNSFTRLSDWSDCSASTFTHSQV